MTNTSVIIKVNGQIRALSFIYKKHEIKTRSKKVYNAQSNELWWIPCPRVDPKKGDVPGGWYNHIAAKLKLQYN